MRIAVTGATGLVGRALCMRLAARGDEVVGLTRDPSSAKLPEGVEVARFEVGESGPLAATLSGADAVVNLMGEPIFGRRWTPEVKEELRRSRVEGTKTVVAAMATADPPPTVLVNASAVGFYGPRGEEEVSEEAEPGDDFLAGVAVEWEKAATDAERIGARVVLLRLGVVLAAKGGALEKMLPPFRMFVGGRIGHGRQGFSFIHLDDLTGMILHVLDRREVRGPVNATAPHPLSNKGFAKAVGRTIGRPSWLPAPAFMLRLMLGEVAGILTTGQFAVPSRALESGFSFSFPTADTALGDLLD